MKVTISVGGKFHAFHLAKQLYKRGYLDKIFTSYPWFAVKDADLPRNKVGCLFIKEILDRLLHKVPYLSRKIDIRAYILDFFDGLVAKQLKPCDIFVGAPGYSLHTLKKARQSFSAKAIIECVDRHIEEEKNILRQEGKTLGIKLNLPSSRVTEKVLAEYQEADYIVIPSLVSKQTFLRNNFPENKLICIPWGVDIETFRPIPKNDNTFRIISVGPRIIKGTHYLLQALEELKIKDLELWLIGAGIEQELMPFLKKYSRNFRYLGAVPQRELYKYYSQGSVFIQFSLSDGFGMTVLEAMACGLTVICTDKVGAGEVIRDNIDGFIVPARDIEALKEKILYLYQNPQIFRQMGREAQENITKNFTWDNYGQKVVSAYLNLLK